MTYLVEGEQPVSADSGHIHVFDADLTFGGGSADPQCNVEAETGFFMAVGSARKGLSLRLQPSDPNTALPSSFWAEWNQGPTPPPPYWTEVSLTEGNCVSFYSQAEGGDPLTSLRWGWSEIGFEQFTHTATPTQLYVKAVTPGTCTINLNLTYRPHETCWPEEITGTYDKVKVTVLAADLDVDSDNNNGYGAPDRSAAEEQIEDTSGDPTKPGKVMSPNSDDNDGDGIPDFADGFNWDGTPGNADDTNGSEQFVPLVLELPTPVSLTEAKVKLTYDASDPAGVTHTGTPPVYAPASGKLRIWKVAGSQARNKNSANAEQNPGDYVPSDTYSPSQLGLAGQTRIVTLYVEPIGCSTAVADLRVKLEVDPDGDGSAGFFELDAVRFTVVGVDLVVAGVDEDHEMDPGAFVALNNDDDDSDTVVDYDDGYDKDGIPGNADDVNASEDDLVAVTLSVAPQGLAGTVTLSKTDAGDRVKLWTSATKGAGNEVTLPPNPAWTTANMPAELRLEGCAASGGLGDVVLVLQYTGYGLTVPDTVKVTVLKVEITELGFKNDHMISKWPSGTHIDDPDGSAPVWKKIANPDDPVCYTKSAKVTMFGTFAVSPALTSQLTGVGLRAKNEATAFAQKDNVTLQGASVVVNDIGGTQALETTVKTTTPTFKWEISLDGGSSWASQSTSGPHTMHWVKETPAASPLYDLGLQKGCGYVNGDADIPGKINSGLAGEIYYNPSGGHHEGLLIFASGTGQCCCHASAFCALIRHLTADSPSSTDCWGGCSAGTHCHFQCGAWWGPTFQCDRPAADAAPSNPHFYYHVEVTYGGTTYDPSYGLTGWATFLEAAPAQTGHPVAASQRTGSYPPGTTHNVNWTCPH